jgi:hypothetical protein
LEDPLFDNRLSRSGSGNNELEALGRKEEYCATRPPETIAHIRAFLSNPRMRCCQSKGAQEFDGMIGSIARCVGELGPECADWATVSRSLPMHTDIPDLGNTCDFGPSSSYCSTFPCLPIMRYSGEGLASRTMHGQHDDVRSAARYKCNTAATRESSLPQSQSHINPSLTPNLHQHYRCGGRARNASGSSADVAPDQPTPARTER